MIIRRIVLILSSVFIFSVVATGCSSDEDPVEPAELDGPLEPEKVSFADWERPENCELGTMPVIGEAECQRVGSECPAGDWPAAIPEAEQVIYVQPGAEGDGSSKTSAVGTISDAVELAQEGAVIVLSKGVHEDNLILEKSLNIIGACPVGTTVRGKTSMGGMSTNINSDTPLTLPSNEQGEMLAVFYLNGELELSFQDLMITGDNLGIVVDGAQSTTLNLQSVVFNELMSSALFVQGEYAEVIGNSITVQNTKLQEDSDQGKGMRILDGITELERTFFDNNFFAGISCDSKTGSDIFSRLNVTDSVFVNGKPCPAGSRSAEINGQAIMAYKCHASVNKTLIDNNSFYGIGLFNTANTPAVLVVTDVVIRNTNPTPGMRTSELFPWADNEAGFGLVVWGGEAYVDRVLLENNSTANVLVMESAYPCETTLFLPCKETFAVLENITSKSAQMDTTGHFGSGAVIMDGAEALVSKAKFDGSYNTGVLVMDAMRRNGSGDTVALFTDVQVSNVSAGEAADEASGTDTFGDGIVVANGALASFNRFKVSKVERVGILLNGKYDWEKIENNFGKRDQVSKEAVERSKKDKEGKRDAVLSFGSVEKAKVGINNQMVTEELGKRDKIGDISSSVTTSETESSYSTDAIAIPAFSFLNKEFMEAVFGAAMDSQEQ